MNFMTANTISFLAEAEKSNWEWASNIFTFIGIIVCLLVTLIAIVWLTCFFVKLLVKTFGVRVGKSYDLMVEDITKKAEAKKERNEKKRQAKFEQKNELLDMKLESKQRVHEMKKKKLADSLGEKEKVQKTKLFGEEAENVKIEPKKSEQKKEKAKQEKEVEPQEKVEKDSESEE